MEAETKVDIPAPRQCPGQGTQGREENSSVEVPVEDSPRKENKQDKDENPSSEVLLEGHPEKNSSSEVKPTWRSENENSSSEVNPEEGFPAPRQCPGQGALKVEDREDNQDVQMKIPQDWKMEPKLTSLLLLLLCYITGLGSCCTP